MTELWHDVVALWIWLPEIAVVWWPVTLALLAGLALVGVGLRRVVGGRA
jgi:hypothetical protein